MNTPQETTEATRSVVQRMYRLYTEGNIEEAAYGLAEEVDWAIMAPPHLFSFAGARRGREAVLGAFQEIAREYEFLAYNPKLILADGKQACVYSQCVVRNRATGHGTNMELCAVMTVDAGKVSWFREFVDSAGTAFVLSGGAMGAA